MPNTKALDARTSGAAAPAWPDGGRSAPFEWAAGVLWIVLLWAWISPIAEMSHWTSPEKTVPLYAATAFFVAVDMLRAPAVFGVPLKAAAAFLAVGWLFRETGGHSGFGLDWLQAYGSLSAGDGRAAAAGEWDRISGENRTLVFLAGWALLAGVVQSVLVWRRRALWLVLATWSYLLALQLWPGLDTTREMIAAGAAGSALLAVLQVERIRSRYAPGLVRLRPPASADVPEPSGESSGAEAEPKPAPAWTPARPGRGSRSGASVPPGLHAAALAATLALFVAALAAAGRDGGAMKPLDAGVWGRFAEAFRPDTSGTGPELEANPAAALQAVTGYGGSDALLGGPLGVKDEPVFTARTPVRTYWRGESKSFYDGRGWREHGTVTAGAAAGSGPFLSGTAELADGENLWVTQELLYTGPRSLNLLFAGGTVGGIADVYTLEGLPLAAGDMAADPETGRYALPPEKGELGYVRFRVRLPDAVPEALEQAQGDFPEAVKTAYLQLPEKLPQRVKSLARSEAGAGASPYAKALLLERYLKETYRYSLTDVSVPAAGQDFVDAFLFGGRGGYCDYFSTAMTVMLRSVGVPARWVKGFAPGEAVSAEGGMMTFAVSTKDAHSWVEAYIPGAGWVPFDPTPGYAGFAPEEAERLALLGQTLKQAKADVPPKTDWAAAGWVRTAFERLQPAVLSVVETGGRAAGDWLSRNRLVAAAVLLASGAALYVLRTRGHLLALLLLLRSRRRGALRPARALKLLDRLWLRVFRLYGGLLPGQTLREYAQETGERVPPVRDALVELVLLYEHVRYAGERPPWLTRRRMTAIWRRLFGGGEGRNAGRGVPL